MLFKPRDLQRHRLDIIKVTPKIIIFKLAPPKNYLHYRIHLTFSNESVTKIENFKLNFVTARTTRSGINGSCAVN